jgi:ribosomal protein S11
MRRGTTPVITLTVDGVDLENAGNLYVTFRQGNHILTKQTGDSGFAVSGQVIGVHLAQNETLDMDAGMVEVQVRGIDSGGEAFASEIAMLPVKQVLLEGVIR